MNWFNQNRWLGTFFIVLGVATLAAGYFLFSAKGKSNEALARFQESTSEKNRLDRLDPFPSEANVRKMKIHLENYTAALDKLKEDLKTRVPSPPPLAPNEFQAHLRQTMLAVAERARNNRVKLPDNFALGFDEYTSALPATDVTPLLGQELTQVELLLNLIIDAHVDGITALVRRPVAEEHGGAAAAPTPAPATKAPAANGAAATQVVDRDVVEVTFTCVPSSGRKVLNQMVSSPQQFYVVRALHVHDEKDKGPLREQLAPATVAGQTALPAQPRTTLAPAPGPKPTPTGALNFIVGNEHIEVTSRIELLRFKF